MQNNIKIGYHVSMAQGYLNAAKEASSIGAKTLQFFSRNPRGGQARAVDIVDIQRFLEFSNKNDFANVSCHAPYTLNPCSATVATREFAKQCLREDFALLDNFFGRALYTIHPGCFTTLELKEGISFIVEALNATIKKDMQTTVLLETMSGKGSEIGGTFEQIAEIISAIFFKDKVGVCLDTCHLFAAGYDIVNNLDGVLDEFDNLIGLEKAKMVHLNDSMVPFNSKKDRHAKIGEGLIGLDALKKFINHPKLSQLPFILETPTDVKGYEEEIKLLTC